MKLEGQPVDFGLDSRLVDQHGLGEQIALILGQDFALLAKPQAFMVDQFEGQALYFELGGVERRLATGKRLLGQGQFSAELFHRIATG